MRRFVLDASYAISWVIDSERTPGGMRQFRSLSREEAQAVVPALWADEVANVFITLGRQRKLTAAQVQIWSETFASLPIEVKLPSIEESLHEVRLLAETQSLTAYDARYLHLAMRESLPLATRDKQLLQAAPRLGVKLVEI